MLAEAQKYIGYPYVWGGSSPATSFDCSGYVSWVINHSVWNVGRLGAQGLYNICLLYTSVVNLLEGYGSDNPGSKSQGMKQLMAGGGIIVIGTTLIPLLSGLF